MAARIVASFAPGNLKSRKVPAKPWQSWQLALATFSVYAIAPFAGTPACANTLVAPQAAKVNTADINVCKLNNFWRVSIGAKPRSGRWPVYRRCKALTVVRTA